nr:prepilin peptidase [Ardenticatenales bacterium]
MGPTILFTILAGLLAWTGARWSQTLPYYEEQRRAIPYRTLFTVALAMLSAGIAAWQGESMISKGFMALWSVVFTLIAVIDIETHFIPNVLSLPATGLALLASLVDPRLNWRSSLLGALLGLIIFYVIYRVARGGFGMGDVTLSAFM